MSDQIIVLSDRTKELSHTTGVLPFVLDGAARGFSTFGDFYASGDAVYYAVTDGTDYEVGSGQYHSDPYTNSLTRFPFRSTNSDNAVSFSEGIKEVFVTYPGKYSVFTASGLGPFQEPKASGIAFWGSSQILCHDHNLTWNPSGNKLGISQSDPVYALDVGGTKAYSQIRASGFLDGGSGILFSGVAGSYSGGRQLEPFLRNVADDTTGANAVIALSGLVDQGITFIKQPKGMVFAGPPAGCGGALGCADDYPTFRHLASGDLPELQYIIQYNDADPNTDGAIALYEESGVAKYNNLFFYKDSTSTLALNTANPQTTTTSEDMSHVAGASSYPTVLDAHGSVFVSGYMEQYGSFINHLKIRTPELEVLSSAEGATPTATVYNLVVLNEMDVQGENTIKFVTLSGVSGVMDHLRFDNHQVRIGEGAGGSGIADEFGTYTSVIGSFAGSGASGCDSSNIIGYQAGVASSGSIVTNMIGSYAGYQTTGVSYSNLIGSGAGTQSSGIFNQYIGANAGYQTSGNNNIEIVTSGSFPSLLHSGEAPTSNKLNIGSTLVGDTASKRVAIGFVSGVDLSPDSTLQVLPSAISDIGFSVRGNYGHESNLFEVHSGDATVLMNIDPSGSIFSSGTISASGGVLIPQLVPDVISNKLYNDGGTLKFGGDTIERGGSYTFAVFDGASASGLISDHQTLTVSGASGIAADFDATTRQLTINPSGLSGILIGELIAISGWASGEIAAAANYQDWKVSDGTIAGDTIVSHEIISFSGVSGVATHWDSSLNRLEINASGLSGILQDQITALTVASPDLGASSGIKRVGNDYILDPNGSGQINNLTFGTSAQERIKIGTGAGQSDFTYVGSGVGDYTVSIGFLAGSGGSGNDYTNVIGYSGSVNSTGITYGNVIGFRAGEQSSGNIDTNIIGYRAGVFTSEIQDSNIIGTSGCYLASGCNYVNTVGYQAGYQISGIDYSNMVGHQVGTRGANYHSVNIVGRQAGYESSGITYANIIGTYAGYRATGCTHSNIIGINAGFQAKNEESINMIGTNAGYLTTGCNYSNVVGLNAGYQATGCNYSNMIGTRAGFQANVSSSINIIGEDAGRSSNNCNNSNIIGHDAGYEATGCISANILGSGAGYAASGAEYTNMIGHSAGLQSSGCGYNNMIGSYAGQYASGCINANMIGTSAGNGALDCDQSNMIGGVAGTLSSGNTNTNMIGFVAGYASSGCGNSEMIGNWAGRYSIDSSNTVMIGSYAGNTAYNSDQSVMIGNYAGASTTNSNYCTYIGYYAGNARKADSSLILKTDSNTDSGATWASTTTDGIIDIANIIQGKSTLTAKHLRIGAELPDDPDGETELVQSCLSVKSHNQTDITLKLIPNSTQTASQFVTSVGGNNNTIITNEGYLKIPVATQTDSSHAELKDVDNNVIEHEDGVVALYNISGNEFLCVSIGGTWFATSELNTLHSLA